uniref:FBD domain-containing protein n=1 Tax=Arundo donax TaxID=35708 RepID=A0A0A9D7K9_ARUDO
MDETFDYLDLWIRYALSCKVQVLRIISDVEYDLCPLPDMPLVSDKSTTVELCRVEPREPLLDFSGCSALQDLTMSYSTVENILSPSVKRLSICYCTFSRDFRARISAPSLVFLELVSYSGMTPFLDNMPSLVSASIRHGDLHHEDRCKSRFEIGGCADVSCQGCVHSKGDGNKSVLLASLSHALHLKLTSDEGMFIFRRYLTLRPVFSKLKTLVLDDWCMVANLHALIFFLQHSPLLEKLTLKLSTDHEDTVAKEAKYEWTEQAFAFKHLTVEVKCYEFSERIKKNLEVLVSCGVPPGQIKILRYRKISRR